MTTDYFPDSRPPPSAHNAHMASGKARDGSVPQSSSLRDWRLEHGLKKEKEEQE